MKVKHLLFFCSLAFFTFSVYKHSTAKSCKKQYEEYCQNLLIQQLYRANNDPADTEQHIAILEQQPTTARTEGNRYDQDVEVIEQVITPKKRIPKKDGEGKSSNKKASKTSKGGSGAENLEVKVTHETPEFNFLGGYAYANMSLIRPPITYARSRKMNKIVAKNAKQKFLECSPAKLPKERFTPSKMQTKPFNANDKTHLIFCASSGSSGTLYLASK